jgi:hypothetical protein
MQTKIISFSRSLMIMVLVFQSMFGTFLSQPLSLIPVQEVQAADLNDPTCEVNNECNYIGSPRGRWGFCNAGSCQAPVCGNSVIE